MAKTLGYIRVSTDRQDCDNQRGVILEYAHTNRLLVDDIIDVTISSRKDMTQRRISELLARLESGDVLLVAELSRLGRSIEEVIHITNSLVRAGVRLVAIKQGVDIRGEHDMSSKVITAVFGLLAELERDLISSRTKAALAARKASGVKLGRPRGSISHSKLDEKREVIAELLRHRVSRSAVARMMAVSRSNLADFIKSRGLAV